MSHRAFISLVIGFIAFLALLSAIITFTQKDIAITDKIALVKVEGPIIQSKSIVDELKDHRKNRQIKAIVMRIESPGGGVVPSQEIYEEVKKTVQVKPVVVSMGSVAASGGYYIASPASKIVANPGTVTGSIGVIMEIPNLQGLMDKVGIKTEVIKSGRYKDMASVFRGIGKEQREILQNLLDNVHEQFIKAVAEGRKMPIDKVRELSDGTVFSGVQALKVGLVDQLGTLEDSIKLASSLAGIKGEPTVVTKKSSLYLMDLLENKLKGLSAKSYPTYELKYLLLLP